MQNLFLEWLKDYSGPRPGNYISVPAPRSAFFGILLSSVVNIGLSAPIFPCFALAPSGTACMFAVPFSPWSPCRSSVVFSGAFLVSLCLLIRDPSFRCVCIESGLAGMFALRWSAAPKWSVTLTAVRGGPELRARQSFIYFRSGYSLCYCYGHRFNMRHVELTTCAVKSVIRSGQRYQPGVPSGLLRKIKRVRKE